MPENVEFSCDTNQVEFRIRSSGNKIIMSGFVMDDETAANLAWLINHNVSLKVEMKEQT